MTFAELLRLARGALRLLRELRRDGFVETYVPNPIDHEQFADAVAERHTQPTNDKELFSARQED